MVWFNNTICISLSFEEDLTLSLSSTSGSPNQHVNVTLSLSYPGAATASAFQLDITYDTAVLENPTATKGPVLTSAGKDLSTSQPSPGVFRRVASGLNQNVIQAGNAATVGFHIKATASHGANGFNLEQSGSERPWGSASGSCRE